MIKTFGKMPTGTPPKGFFKAVHFPNLANLDTETGDGRLIESDGFGTRDLPLSIRVQLTDDYGHTGAVVSGSLFEVTIDPEGKLASGNGFLLDDENGRTHARLAHLGALRGNSVDLAEVKYRIEWKSDDPSSPDFFEYTIIFTKSNLAATTGVGTPAFKDARMEIDLTDAELDELMASLTADPMTPVIHEFDSHTVHFDLPDPLITRMQADELVAAGLIQKREAFFRPEAAKPHPVRIDADGNVFGHLGLWNTCHDGIEGQCVIIPRPQDSYASFNKSCVLTDRGMVETGPIFLYGGHRKIGGKLPEDVYGGTENAWGDLRVVEGVHGPWLSGRVRPGVTDEMVYAARASRVSGHWVGGALKAIVSVNAEGFEVPGSGEDRDLALELAAGFGAHVTKEGVTEMVASFPRCEGADEPEDKTVVQVELSDEERERVVAEVLARLSATTGYVTFEATSTTITEAATEVVVEMLEEEADDDLIAADDEAVVALLEDEAAETG